MNQQAVWRRLLQPFWERPESSGVFTDFDGTLAAIVDDPAAACPLPGAGDLLRGLARRYGRVGVVSGRPVGFLQEHLGCDDLFLAGLYGLEMWDDGVRPHEEAEQWRPTVEAATGRAEDDLAGSGVGVERKGLSVALHLRVHPEAETAAREWAAAEAERSGLVVHEGRKSLELRPPVGSDKGTVLRDAARGLSAVCFIGDDKGDLAAFDALDELATGGATRLAVAVSSEEAPPELAARADVVVDGPEDVLALLELLLSGP